LIIGSGWEDLFGCCKLKSTELQIKKIWNFMVLFICKRSWKLFPYTNRNEDGWFMIWFLIWMDDSWFPYTKLYDCLIWFLMCFLSSNPNLYLNLSPSPITVWQKIGLNVANKNLFQVFFIRLISTWFQVSCQTWRDHCISIDAVSLLK
jgi:hypothetical protein